MSVMSACRSRIAILVEASIAFQFFSLALPLFFFFFELSLSSLSVEIEESTSPAGSSREASARPFPIARCLNRYALHVETEKSGP